MKHLLNKCPICNGEIVLVEFTQYATNRKIKKNGEVSKKTSKKEYCSGEGSIFSCISCGFATDALLYGEKPNDNIRIIDEGGKYYWEDLDDE